MSVMWSPEKYWNVQDARIPLLVKYLQAIDICETDLLPTERIIWLCIDALHRFKLIDDEISLLKQLILTQNGKILEPCLSEIARQLSTPGSTEITLVSLGCGNESLFERLLDGEISKRLPAIKVNWLGVDIGDFRDPGSFFNTHPFEIINGDSFIRYKSLVEDDTPTALVGRYSYHHLGVELDEFKKRCEGLSRVLLVEEPTTSREWGIADYKIMRIAYDVLANTVFVVDWASEFMKDPDKFKINYLKTDTIPSSCKLLEFKDVLPETALISF